jgi:hypothetical protein
VPPPPPTAVTRPFPSPPDDSSRAWPLLLALLAVGAIVGALLAYFLTRDDSSGTSPTVVTQVRTVTTQGQVSTVERPVTVTTAPKTASPAPSGPSGRALNNAGFAKMQQGDYEGALPLLEQAVQKLSGTGSLDEAFASYNLAFTRFQLGNCDGVLDLIDRSESIQGHRSEIDRLRDEAEETC